MALVGMSEGLVRILQGPAPWARKIRIWRFQVRPESKKCALGANKCALGSYECTVSVKKCALVAHKCALGALKCALGAKRCA